MREQTLKTWEEFAEELRALDELRNKKNSVSKLLFRGQSNSNWRLETTLERYIDMREISLSTYYVMALAAKNKIETFTEKKWDIPSPPLFSDRLKNLPSALLANSIEYEYLAF